MTLRGHVAYNQMPNRDGGSFMVAGQRNLQTNYGEYKIDLDKQSISTADAEHYSALAIIRKQSIRRLLGHVYYLERKLIGGKRTFALYGGGIGHSDPTKPTPDKDRTPAAALARELDEEIGEFGRRPQKFQPADFKEFASLLRNSERRQILAVDIYTLDDPVAEKIHKGHILKYQRKRRAELTDLRLKHKSASQADQAEIETKIKFLEDILGGSPVRVRRWFGVWIMLRWAFPWPFPWRIRPNWSRFSPLAAYSLMTDAWIRESTDAGGSIARGSGESFGFLAANGSVSGSFEICRGRGTGGQSWCPETVFWCTSCWRKGCSNGREGDRCSNQLFERNECLGCFAVGTKQPV
jgi:hypothetical protein